MKNGLALLLAIFLLNCEQQTKQNPSVDKVNASRHKIIFLADTSLKTNQNVIKKIIYAALAKCNECLQSDSLIIHVGRIDNDDIIKKMGGVTGITYDNKHISISIDPNVISWKETLKCAIAHEYNHAYCMKNTFDDTYKWTLLDYLVFEGKADYFAHSLYPNAIAPWTSALSEKEKSTLWTKIKPNLQSKDDSFHSEVMFGSKTYPVWGGYTLGFNIVQSALKNNSNLPVKTWTNLPADKLLEMSEYKLGVH